MPNKHFFQNRNISYRYTIGLYIRGFFQPGAGAGEPIFGGEGADTGDEKTGGGGGGTIFRGGGGGGGVHNPST